MKPTTSRPPDVLPPEDGADDDPLYQSALKIERDDRLASEMAEWEEATLADGLDKKTVAARRSLGARN
jgi:hypothetical protein